MLSFDITDRHIRIVRGQETRGKIRVSSASTIDLTEGLIVNGHIKDIPKMATIINDELKARRMDDKEAVVTLSSNLVMFKEMAIPKAKTSTALLTMVTNQMQHTMGTGEDYSIAYSIAGETQQEGNTALKILATACPFEVVDAFRKVFQMLSISLKSVTVTCNAISRIILSDRRNLAKMPMLAVQVDPTFVSINLYENGQLSFARFASIDAIDYDNSEDYVYEAVNENINRMIQFHKSRSPENPIQNVTFYGDTTDYIRLTSALESMDITTSLLGVPNNIGGYENIEFQAYANAIGAMFRSNKDTDRINLLETDASAGKTDAGGSFFVQVGGAALLSAAVVGAVYLFFNNQITSDKDKIAEHDQWINSPETQQQLQEVDQTELAIQNVGRFKGDVQQATNNYDSKPKLTQAGLIEVYETLEGKNWETGQPLSADTDYDCTCGELTFSDGEFTVHVISMDNRSPDRAVKALYDLGKFDNIIYEGFELSDSDVEQAIEGVLPVDVPKFYEFDVTFSMPANEIQEGGDE
ncbi:MAG: pilus assembly protein PilM [Oscillospiraceae bacterium]|nr:pilus assembly protein PilM [Oscillospiraceae bacterium]